MNAESGLGRQRVMVTAVLLATFMLGMALRLYDLDGDSLWYDEILTGTRAQLDLPSALALGRSGEGLGLELPLTYVVTHFFVSLWGDSDFILRTQAMLFGSLSILLAYEIGRILWTGREGLMGAFLLAVNPYHIRYSQEARYYGLMVFLALLSLIFLLKALQRNEKGPWIGFVLCTSLSLYNHYFTFLLLPAEVIFAAWVITENWLSYRRLDGRAPGVRPTRRLAVPIRQALMLSLSLALIGASYVPWIPALRAEFGEQVGSEAVATPTGSVHLPLNFLRSVLATYSGTAGASLLLWLGLFLLGLATCCPQPLVLSLLWMGIPFIFLSIVQPKHSLSPRYVLFILPLFVLVISRGIASLATLVDRLLRGVERRGAWPTAAIVSLTLITFAVLSVAPLSDYYLSQKEDWRAAAGYLSDNMVAGNVILADNGNARRGSQRVRVGLSYYLASYGITEVPILGVGRELWRDLRDLERRNGGIWVVLWDAGTPQRTELVEIANFKDVSVMRLGNASGLVLQDSVSVLQVLLDLLPDPEARFDVHLALAEHCLLSARFEQARSHLRMASEVMPDGAQRDLAAARDLLEHLSYPKKKDMQHSLWRTLDGVVAFRGYTMDPIRIRRGDTLHVSLWWQALANMDRDYTAFIHLVGPGDHIWAQCDRLLQHDDDHTSTWLAGETAREEYELELPPDIPSGEYIIKTGMYYWETVERLPVWDEHWQRMPDDTILLGRVAVNE